jgi:pilus assembly protein Flp/PilA
MTSKTVDTSKAVDTAAIASAAPSSQRCNLLAFWRGTSGATSIEYALIASGIAVVIAATVFSLGTAVNGLYQSVSDKLH